MGSHLDYMSTGAIAMGYAVAGLFFLRFWRDTRDRLFLFFAAALFVLAANRAAFTAFDPGDAHYDHRYWVRLMAFGVILLAVVDKNRSRRPAS